jgi:hypothetical protein
MSVITEVAIIPFKFPVHDLGLGRHAAMGVSNLHYEKGAQLSVMRYAVQVRTDDGQPGATSRTGSEPRPRSGRR